MENRASKTRSLSIAFVATPDLLKRLAAILGEASKNLEYTVKFSDGTSVHYNDVEEIIKQPNSRRRSIVSLIAGSVGDGILSAYVVLKTAGDSPTVEYTVDGPQRNVIYFADQLDDWIAALRQWYSFAFSSGFGMVLILAAVLAPMYAWDHASHFFFSQAVIEGKSEPWIKPFSLVLMWVAEYFIFRLFPRGTFATGRGATRHQFLTWVRRGVLLTLVLSILASVVANLITRHP